MRRCSTRRMLAGALAFGLATLAGAGAAAAQALGFRSLGAAEAAAARIMEASGLRADFEIVVDPESNKGWREAAARGGAGGAGAAVWTMALNRAVARPAR